MTTLAWITNIPAPYRNHRYRLMRRILPEFDISFVVYYMAASEAHRPWRFSSAELDHPHRIYGGLHPRVLGVTLHTNPRLLIDLRRRSPDVVVVGGYSAPTLALAPFAAPSDVCLLLGSETNVESEVRSRGLTRSFKVWLSRKFDGAIVPGERQEAHLRSLSPHLRQAPMIRLPNIVDESKFSRGIGDRKSLRVELRSSLRVPKGHQLWLCPARLETFKGLDLLIDSLAGVAGVTLVSAGTGSQIDTLSRQSRACGVDVRFLGQVRETRMLDLYAAADVFALPSRRDPSPLSVVEAAAAGLPLLLSSHVGNLPEALSGGGGWTFSLEDPAHQAAVVAAVAGLSQAELEAVGLRAAQTHAEVFDSERCITSMGRQLNDLVAGLSQPH